MTFLNKLKGKAPAKPTILVAINPRPKGYILQGVDWDYFCWNESSLAQSLELALEKWIGKGELDYIVLLEPIDPKDRNSKIKLRKVSLTDFPEGTEPIVWNMVGEKYVSNYMTSDGDDEVMTDW